LAAREPLGPLASGLGIPPSFDAGSIGTMADEDHTVSYLSGSFVAARAATTEQLVRTTPSSLS